MDILISSNLERLLAHETGLDGQQVAAYMDQLQKQGEYQIDSALLHRLQKQFAWRRLRRRAGLPKRSGQVYAESGQVLDPHTAVGMHVLRQLRSEGFEKNSVRCPGDCFVLQIQQGRL